MLQQYASIMAFSRYLIVALLMFSAGFMLGRMSIRSKTELKVERPTDTVVIRQPEIMVVHTLAPDTVRLAVVDTLHDTTHVLVEVPRQQHRYEGEGYRGMGERISPLARQYCNRAADTAATSQAPPLVGRASGWNRSNAEGHTALHRRRDKF